MKLRPFRCTVPPRLTQKYDRTSALREFNLAYVACGSLADFVAALPHVSFTPKAVGLLPNMPVRNGCMPVKKALRSEVQLCMAIKSMKIAPSLPMRSILGVSPTISPRW